MVVVGRKRLIVVHLVGRYLCLWYTMLRWMECGGPLSLCQALNLDTGWDWIGGDQLNIDCKYEF